MLSKHDVIQGFWSCGFELVKRLLTSCCLFASIVVLPLAAGETYFRYIEPALFEDQASAHLTPEALRERSLQYQPTIYARHVLPAMTQRVDAWGGGQIEVNSNGYRGEEFSVRKPPGTIRIMIIGGSSVFDLGAPKGLDWPHQVEQRLRDLGMDAVEVLNAGIPGHASTDAVTRLMTEGHYLNPDYVLLYTGWNDIKYFDATEPILRQMEPLSLNPMLYYQGRTDRFLGETFKTYVRLRQAYWGFRLGMHTEGIIGQHRLIEQTLELGEILLAPERDEHGIYDTGLIQFEMNIRNFTEIVRNLGATPILVTQANLVHPTNSEAEKKRVRYDYVALDHAGLVHAFAKVRQILIKVAEDKQVPLIDAEMAVPKNLEHFHDHVHLKAPGSSRAAMAVTEGLRSLLPN